MKDIPGLWFHVLAIALLVVSLGCSADPLQRENIPNNSNSNGSNATISVLARDFSLSLDVTEVEAGAVAFVVQNNGTMQHDFAIRGNGVESETSMIEPGESASLTVDLEPGTYTYFCTIPGHEQAGMSGTFAVNSN